MLNERHYTGLIDAIADAIAVRVAERLTAHRDLRLLNVTEAAKSIGRTPGAVRQLILSPFFDVDGSELAPENTVKQVVLGVLTGVASTALGYKNSYSDSTAVTVLLSGGYHALIDLADFDRVAAHKWSHHTNGTHHYAVREERGVRIYLHRFLMQAPAGCHVDHINGDGLDCRRANMRLCTNAQNSQNRRARKDGIGLKGVCLRKSGRWRAQVRASGRTIHIGLYNTPHEAARAYDAKARELFGEFARTNF